MQSLRFSNEYEGGKLCDTEYRRIVQELKFFPSVKKLDLFFTSLPFYYFSRDHLCHTSWHKDA